MNGNGGIWAEATPTEISTGVYYGSWLCKNALKGGLIRRDFSDVAAISHFAEFGPFSFRKGLLT
jgi:hypothetical protein